MENRLKIFKVFAKAFLLEKIKDKKKKKYIYIYTFYNCLKKKIMGLFGNYFLE